MLSASIITEQLHQEEGRWESKTHKNGEEMPQTLISTLVDCYFFYL
jgi:hypothetical protein